MPFHFPHVRILGTHHYGKELFEAFKHQVDLHGDLCWHDYAELVVYIFLAKSNSNNMA